MPKTLFIILIQFALIGTLQAIEVMTDKTKLQAIKMKNKVLQDPVLHIKAVIEKPHNYIVKLEARSPRGSQILQAVLDKKSDELYIGAAYEKSGKPIVFPKDKKAISDGVAFSYGKGTKDVYIVTDPECPYCSKFEKSIHGKLDELYRVHVILMPLSFHKKAPAMIEWIMQSSDDEKRKERFEAIMLKGSTAYTDLIKDTKKPFSYSTGIHQYIQKSNLATAELNVRGTPAVYDANFKAISQDQLLNKLKKGDKK